MASVGKRKRNDNEDANELTIDGINTIYVKTFTGETFSLQVKGSDTIVSLKFKITDKIDYLPYDEQALLFNDMLLEDLLTLADYRVKKNSTLTLMRKSSGLVPIFIDNLIGNDSIGKRRWPVNVKLSDTVSDLKDRISYLIYAHSPKEVVIVSNDIVLEDHCILADFHITRDSVLTLMRKSPSKKMEIFVKILSGKTISMDVIATTTIGQVKNAISYKEMIPVDEQVLIFNEMVLDESSIIFDFGIKKGSTLTLMRVSKGLMQIYVKTVTGMSTSFQVKPSDTIENLKSQINDKVGIPIDKQVLIFNEMVLHDSGKLADLHIKTDSTLTVMRKSRGSMQIFIHSFTGRKFPLEINPLHTIANLKARVSNEEGIPPEKLRLIFDGRCLEDSHTLADYNIQKDDVIHFNLRLGGWYWGNGLEI